VLKSKVKAKKIKQCFGDETSLRLQVERAEERTDAVGLSESVSLCPLTENLSHIEPEFILLTVH